jgi:hypothetical protein
MQGNCAAALWVPICHQLGEASMKKYVSILLASACLLIGSAAQAQMTRIQGTVKDNSGNPIPGAQLVFNNKENGQKITLKTDKKGKYVAITLPPGKYDVQVNQDGKTIYTLNAVPISLNGCCGGERDGINLIDIDLQKEQGAQQQAAQQYMQQSGAAGAAPEAGAQQQLKPQQQGAQGKQQAPQLTPEQKKQIEEIQKKNAAIVEENKKIGNLNELMAQAKTADQAKQFDQAVESMKQATQVGGSYPVVWANLGSYELDWAKTAPDADTRKQRASQAVGDLQKALEMCAADTTGKLQGCQPAQLAAFHNSLGNGLADTGDTEKANAEFQAAAKADPAGASRYYFNAGAVMTNQASRSKSNEERSKFIEAANHEFEQAIAANPKDPAPYCEKGKNLLNKATLSKDGKMVAPDGTSDALNQCIQLDPNSQRAEEAKQLLAALGESVSTSYKAGKKKP